MSGVLKIAEDIERVAERSRNAAADLRSQIAALGWSDPTAMLRAEIARQDSPVSSNSSARSSVRSSKGTEDVAKAGGDDTSAAKTFDIEANFASSKRPSSDPFERFKKWITDKDNLVVKSSTEVNTVLVELRTKVITQLETVLDHQPEERLRSDYARLERLTKQAHSLSNQIRTAALKTWLPSKSGPSTFDPLQSWQLYEPSCNFFAGALIGWFLLPGLDDPLMRIVHRLRAKATLISGESAPAERSINVERESAGPSVRDKVRDLRKRLASIQPASLDPSPWSSVDNWIASARPLIKSQYSEHYEDFVRVATPPEWYRACLIREQRSEELEYLSNSRERLEDGKRATASKARILAFVDGLLDLPALSRSPAM